MAEIITQLGIGGILVLLVIREFLAFIARRKESESYTSTRRPTTDKFKTIQGGVDAILQRLDRIVERLEDLAGATRAARKQTEITGEMTERMCRAVGALEETLNDAATRRRTTDTSPGF